MRIPFVSLLAAICLFMMSVPVLAHHGTSISYDMTKPFKLKAVITEFRYSNPHPSLYFDVTNDKGEVEHWVSELQTNVSFLMRAGWTKKRSEEAMKPGTTVLVTLCRSKAGGNSGVIQKIENLNGEQIVVGSPRDRESLVEP
jgi:hypothetical protein